MQRVWRSKPTPELIRIFEESVDLRLYLVAEKGPLSFTFQDDKAKKFMINIGDKINCNCNGNKKDQKDHCVHTIYVLNRIFKIGFSDQLILQLQYTDSELNKMIETRRKNKNKIDLNINNSSLSDSGSEDDYNNNNKRKKKKKGNFNNENEENRMNLIDDITCSICQEDMYNAEGLFYCEESCGHNYHLDCLKIWSTHKKANEESNITCPMCRQKWNDEKLKKQIVKNMANKKNIKSHKGVNCKNCDRKNIKGERFHCLICDDYNLCIECYNLGIHKNFHNEKDKKNTESNTNICFYSINILDNPLIIKKSPEESWHGFENSIERDEEICRYTIKQIKFSQYLISLLKDFDGKLTQINKEMNNVNLDMNSNIPNEDSERNFNSGIPEDGKDLIEDENLNVNNNEEINSNNNIESKEIERSKNNYKDLNCIICRKSFRSSTLHLLKYKQAPECGHIIHIKCVELLFKVTIDKSSNFRVEEGFNICKLDNKFIFPGLKSLKFNIYKSNEEGNIDNNISKANNKNNQNDFYLINGINNQIQNLSNNNFPSSSQKNKIFTGRVLTNRKGLLANDKPIKNDLFENALQINNMGLKVGPLISGKSLSGRLAPISQQQNGINAYDFQLNNLGNKKRLLSNTKFKKNDQSINDKNVIGLAINIQKVDFDDDNKIQFFEKSTRERIKEFTSNSKLSSGKNHSSVKTFDLLNKKADKSIEKIISIKNTKEKTFPDFFIGNSNKYHNSDLPDIDPVLINERECNEEINTRIINKPIRGKSIRTINHNNLGLKVLHIKAFFIFSLKILF